MGSMRQAVPSNSRSSFIFAERCSWTDALRCHFRCNTTDDAHVFVPCTRLSLQKLYTTCKEQYKVVIGEQCLDNGQRPSRRYKHCYRRTLPSPTPVSYPLRQNDPKSSPTHWPSPADPMISTPVILIPHHCKQVRRWKRIHGLFVTYVVSEVQTYFFKYYF
jgi:hypothetical protein